MNNIIPLTDNLYKFIAISGLLILGYSSYFYLYSTANLKLKIIKQEANAELLSLELRQLMPSIDKAADNQSIDQEFFNCIRNHETKVKSKTKVYDLCLDKHSSTKKGLLNRHKLTDKMLLNINETRHELRKLSINLERETKIIKYNLFQLNTFAFFLKFILALGVLMMSLGFYFWYKKVQKPQDDNLTKLKE